VSPNKSAPPRYTDLPDLLTPDDARAFLQISRNTMYELLRTEKIRSIRFGKLIRIPKAALLEGAG
jgi:excisionase family DNA binding protein